MNPFLKIKSMKKFYIILVALLVVNVACERSQFSTTTRHSKNGKVLYANHHPVERKKLSNGKSHKSNIKEAEAKNITTAVAGTEMQNLPEPGVTKDNNVLITNSINLLASTSNNPIIYNTNINLINSDNYKKNPINDYSRGTMIDSIADTIKSKRPDKNLTFDPYYVHIIKFKSGNEETVRIISHSHDGLYYQLISEPKKTKFVMMAQVDTILTDTMHSFKQGKEITKKEAKLPEMKGLKYSLIGFVPVIGIAAAIIGIILGARNLHRIRKNLASIKGKKIAISSVIIGVVALIFNVIITIALFSAVAAAMSSSISGCKSGIHF